MLETNVLAVFENVVATWRAILREGFALIVALALPAACISFIEFASQEFPSRFLYTFFFLALTAPFYVLFAVVCHRSMILGGSSLPNRFGLFWSGRETRFLGWTIAIIIVTLLLSVGISLLLWLSPLAFLGRLGPLAPLALLYLVWLLLGYLYVRFAMVFPATAVEEDTDFGRAWSLSEGNGFRIVGVIVFSVAPIILAFYVVLYFFGPTGFLANLIGELLRHVVSLVAICALSISYLELVDIENSALPE